MLLADKDREIGVLAKGMQQCVLEKEAAVEKFEQAGKQLDTLKCQLTNLKIVNDNITKSLEGKVVENRELNDQVRRAIMGEESVTKERDSLAAKYATVLKQLEASET